MNYKWKNKFLYDKIIKLAADILPTFFFKGENCQYNFVERLLEKAKKMKQVKKNATNPHF